MKTLKIIDKVWTEIEKGILSITTILVSLLLVSNALSRYFFNKSFGFSEELGKMGIIVLTFMGLGYAAKQHMHIEMSGLYDILPAKFKYVLDLIINLGSFLVLGLCAYLGLQYVMHLYDLGQVSTILRWPLYLTMSVIPLGFFLGALRFLIEFIGGLKFSNTKHAESNN